MDPLHAYAQQSQGQPSMVTGEFDDPTSPIKSPIKIQPAPTAVAVAPAAMPVLPLSSVSTPPRPTGASITTIPASVTPPPNAMPARFFIVSVCSLIRGTNNLNCVYSTRRLLKLGKRLAHGRDYWGYRVP